MDVGQPRDYLTGLTLYLRALRERNPAALASGARALPFPHASPVPPPQRLCSSWSDARGGPLRVAAGDGIVGNVLMDPTAKVGAGCKIGPDVCIGPGCVVEDGVRLTRCTVLRGAKARAPPPPEPRRAGAGVATASEEPQHARHGEENRTETCFALPQIKEHACITFSLIGWDSSIGRWARLENCCVLGEDVQARGRARRAGARLAGASRCGASLTRFALPPQSQMADEVYVNGGVVLPHKEIKANIHKPQIIM